MVAVILLVLLFVILMTKYIQVRLKRRREIDRLNASRKINQQIVMLKHHNGVERQRAFGVARSIWNRVQKYSLSWEYFGFKEYDDLLLLAEVSATAHEQLQASRKFDEIPEVEFKSDEP